MSNLEKKIKGWAINTLLLGGLTLTAGSQIGAAYLDHIQPEKPQVLYEYEKLNRKHQYLTSFKKFSLDEALNKSYMQEQSDRADSLSKQINSIEQSQEFHIIEEYKEEKSRHDKRHYILYANLFLGIFSAMYGLDLTIKNQNNSTNQTNNSKNS